MPKKSETHCCVLKCNNNGKNKPEISFSIFLIPVKKKTGLENGCNLQNYQV